MQKYFCRHFRGFGVTVTLIGGLGMSLVSPRASSDDLSRFINRLADPAAKAMSRQIRNDSFLLGVLEGAGVPITKEFDFPVLTSTARNGGSRQLVDVAFDVHPFGRLELLISSPKPLEQLASRGERLPVLLVLGGLASDPAVIRHLQDPGNNVVVGFRYPEAKTNLSLLDLQAELGSIGKILEEVVEIPIRAALALEWLQSQSWADARRVNILGVSFGAVMTPASLRIAYLRGVTVKAAILGYGGANIHELVPDSTTQALLRPFTTVHEPGNHLPTICGSTNTKIQAIVGKEDPVFPMKSREALKKSCADGRITYTPIDGGHVNENTPDLIEKLIAAATEFLMSNQAIN